MESTVKAWLDINSRIINLKKEKGEKMASQHLHHIEPYSPQNGTVVPLGFVKFMRTCVLWQFIRFLSINIKMTKLILKSHH
jgi:hypothetical protein